MALTKRTKDIMAIALTDSKTLKEMVAILDIVPSAGTKSSFTGPVISTAETNGTFTGQVAGMISDVTIDADVAGVAGNITLTADSISDIDALILAWNTANPTNTVTLSAGDGTQVPTADIVLAGGLDEVTFTLTVEANTAGVAGDKTIVGDGISDCATLIGAGYTITAGGASIPVVGASVSISGGVNPVLAGGTLVYRAKRTIRKTMCDRRASNELITLIQAGSGTMTARTKSILSWALCDYRAWKELVALF